MGVCLLQWYIAFQHAIPYGFIFEIFHKYLEALNHSTCRGIILPWKQLFNLQRLSETNFGEKRKINEHKMKLLKRLVSGCVYREIVQWLCV